MVASPSSSSSSSSSLFSSSSSSSSTIASPSSPSASSSPRSTSSYSLRRSCILFAAFILSSSLAISVSAVPTSPESAVALVLPLHPQSPPPSLLFPHFLSLDDNPSSTPSEPASSVLPIHDKRDDTPTASAPVSSSTTTTKKMNPTPTSNATITATTTPSATPLTDFALFGVPSKLNHFNFTSGLLIYSIFLILFILAVGAGTVQRSRYRSQFREMSRLDAAQSAAKGGKGGAAKGGDDTEMSDAALFKQASLSRRALMKDVGPGGAAAADTALKTRIAQANGAGKTFEERERDNQVSFGEPGARQPGGRAGGLKKSNSGSQGQQYRSDNDYTDYTRPAMTESNDPYYSSGSSNGNGYLDQPDEYYQMDGGPQMPRPTYQNQQSQQQSGYVQRTNSNRMPQQEYRAPSASGNRPMDRSGSNGSNRGQDNIDRSGSNGSNRRISPPPQYPQQQQQQQQQGLSRNNSGGGDRSRGAPSPSMMNRPITPIARSNSSRLPPQMRGGGGSGSGTPEPSGLKQSSNYNDYYM